MSLPSYSPCNSQIDSKLILNTITLRAVYASSFSGSGCSPAGITLTSSYDYDETIVLTRVKYGRTLGTNQFSVHQSGCCGTTFYEADFGAFSFPDGGSYSWLCNQTAACANVNDTQSGSGSLGVDTFTPGLRSDSYSFHVVFVFNSIAAGSSPIPYSNLSGCNGNNTTLVASGCAQLLSAAVTGVFVDPYNILNTYQVDNLSTDGVVGVRTPKSGTCSTESKLIVTLA